jgi:hypothetical protein
VEAPKGKKIAMTLEVPRELELDFLHYRSDTYVTPMTMGVAEELGLMLHSKNLPASPNVKTLCQMFLASSGALMTQWSEQERCFVVTFEVMKSPLWKGHEFRIDTFMFEPEREYFVITDTLGERYQPGDERWETAMNHLVYQYTISIPMASHNWVHFAYPDSFAAAVFKKLSRESVLYKLLYPHTRFTNRINYQAVYIQLSTDNSPSLKNTLTPWKCFPMYGDDFKNGILENTSNHYSNMNYHFDFPDKMDARIPYFDFLKRYYQVIQKFVGKIAPHIDQRDYSDIEFYMQRMLPGFEKSNRVKSLSTLIWQVSVLHTVEHMSYYRLAMEYGFTDLQKTISEEFSHGDVSRFNRFKLRSFLRVFGRFNKSAVLDQRIENYKSYQFEEGSELETIAIEFVRDLKTLESQLKKEGNNILELEQIIQSVCF